MSKEITQEQFVKGLAICSKGKHKLRENKYGIVFCVRCGLLSTSVGNAEKLTADDNVIVNCKNK